MNAYAGIMRVDTDLSLQETGVNPGAGVSVHFPNISSGVLAGVYNLYVKDLLGYTGPINGFCIEDAWQNPGDHPGYEAYTFDSAEVKYNRAAWIAEKYFSGTTTWDAANVQLAIWEIVLETKTTYDIADSTSGVYIYSDLWRKDLVNGIIADSYNKSPDKEWLLLVNPKTTDYPFPVTSQQNYLVPNPVPEPGTLILLGFGLVGLATYGKLRISRKKI